MLLGHDLVLLHNVCTLKPLSGVARAQHLAISATVVLYFLVDDLVKLALDFHD